MQLLIVHREAEIGRQLVQMIRQFTGYDSGLTSSETEALIWLRHHPNAQPRVLLTQLEFGGVDGFALGGILSEMLPGLQILFFPRYTASEQRIEIGGSKVFPEPIEGERLMATIERCVRMPHGAPDLFHGLDVLQLCCLSRRNGAVQLVTEGDVGTVYFHRGNIVQAETTNACGRTALFEIVSWGKIEFAYEPAMRAWSEGIEGRWDELLFDAMEESRRRALPDWRRIA